MKIILILFSFHNFMFLRNIFDHIYDLQTFSCIHVFPPYSLNSIFYVQFVIFLLWIVYLIFYLSNNCLNQSHKSLFLYFTLEVL